MTGAGILASCTSQEEPVETAIAPSTSSTGDTKEGGELVFALNGDVVSLAPFGIMPGLAHEGKELCYDSLVEYDSNLNIQPALAESWENPDDRTWVFHLRQGVKFHDGKDFKAEDVIYSLTLGMDASSVDPAASSVQGFAPTFDSIEAIDDYTVRITTPGADASVLGWFAWARWSVIASKDFYEKYNPSLQVNGTGPFKLVEYIPNDRVVYEKNSDFWKPGEPSLDRITLKIIPDESARLAALRAGEIDGCAFTSADIVRPLEDDTDYSIYSGVTGMSRVLQVSVKNDGKPWDDIRVRQAMSMAIDRKDLIEKAYGGKAELTAAISSGWGGYEIPSDELARNPYLQYDPDQAKSLLEEAGFGDGFEIDLITVAADEYAALGEIIQEHLRRVGIDANLRVLENVQHSAAYRDGNHELFVNAQGFRRDPIGKLTQYGQPDQPPQSTWYNWPNGWKNDKLIELYSQAVSTFDPAERKPIIQEIQRIGLEEATFVFLCVPYRINVVRNHVKGWFIDYMDFHKALRTASVV
jgi:peptide/nickel transport system substrate-binding protein